MKKIPMLFLVLCTTMSAFSQTASVKWGDEFKMHKGSSDLAVISSDNTGVYLKESHQVVRNYFAFTGNPYGESASLVKLDKHFTEIYTNDFNKELKGKDFKQFFVFHDKLYLLATDFDKKTQILTLYGASIDKATGELSGDWELITGWQKEEKNDDIEFKVNYNVDSSQMILVSSIQGKEKNTYEVRQFDKDFKQLGKPVVISNEFDPKTFQLEDVLYTFGENAVLVGRVYEYEDGKKKKDKFLDFSNYNIRIYDNQGALVKEVNTAINGKWLVSTKVVQVRDKDLVLAAFYSNEKKGKEINGLLVQRINPVSGEVISTSQKEINTSLITTVDNDNAGDNEDTKQEQKEQEKLDNIKDNGEGFSKYMQFRGIYYTPDNGIVFLAEKYHHYEETNTYYQPPAFNGMSGTNTSETYAVYECGDLMMSKIDLTGNINWLEILPKAQREVIETGYSVNHGFGGPDIFGFSVGNSYFDDFNLPFYAGFGTIAEDTTLSIVFNDNAKNADVFQLGQKLMTINNFGKSDCFVLTLNELTGKYQRQSIFSNKDIPTAMPRLGTVIGKEMYIVGKNDRTLGKTKIAVGVISLKN